MSCQTVHEVKQMSPLLQRDSIFRTHFKHKRHLTITFEDASHPKNASTNHTQTGLCFPWIRWLIQKIDQKLHKNSRTFNTTDTPASKI